MSSNKPSGNTQLEWYRVLLIIIGAFGIILAFINWYSSGNDIPNGLLTILSLIISAALGPNAVSTVASSIKKTIEPTPESTPVDSPLPSEQPEDTPTEGTR